MTTKKTQPKLPSKKGQSFEAALAELQALVESLEKGEVNLEESLQAFERGVELTRECQAALLKAEQKIQILTQDGQLEAFGYAVQLTEQKAEQDANA